MHKQFLKYQCKKDNLWNVNIDRIIVNDEKHNRLIVGRRQNRNVLFIGGFCVYSHVFFQSACDLFRHFLPESIIQ